MKYCASKYNNMQHAMTQCATHGAMGLSDEATHLIREEESVDVCVG